jgi:DNA gyrase subunit B
MTNDTQTDVEQLEFDADENHAASEAYDPSKFKYLKDAEHIRRRPGMYIGDTSTQGLHHLVYELVYNSVDEALAGYCQVIYIKINHDGSLSVSDDGRGIPVELHPETGLPTLQMVMTLAGSGAKFDKGAYKTSAGLHGMGAKAVTALSEWTEAEVRRNGKVYMQEYARGKAITDVKEIGVSPGNRTGTKVTFQPDPEIFKDAKFDYDTLESRLRELAFLNKGLTIKLHSEKDNREDTFKADGGIGEFVAFLNRTEDTLHDIIYMDKTVDNVRVEVAIQYTTTGEQERVRCYTNNAFNPVGGTHLSGFRAALTRALNAYGSQGGYFKNMNPVGEDFRDGITALINIQVPEPQFESNSKLRLNNPEVEGIVSSVIHEHLTVYLEENPKDAQKIIKKVALAAEAREAAAKAKKALKERKSILSSGGLPGKLMDCTTRDRDSSELFIVEGQSAGGSAEGGRDRIFQAILPLRGKVLNVEKARLEKVLGNEEIRNLITAVGVDIDNPDDVSTRRYGKIVLLTDADVDGQHIRTLLLTFFYRQMRKLIEEGHIYVARPPLFKVTEKKNVRFIQTIEEMNDKLISRGLDDTRLEIIPVLDEISGQQGSPRILEGERLGALMKVLSDVEEPLLILERRGVSLNSFLKKAAGDKLLPAYRVLLSGHEHWFHNREELDAFRAKKKAELGHDLEVGDDMTGSADTNGKPPQTLFEQELHEVHKVNEGLEKLRAFDLGTSDLLPLARIAGREPPQRFFLERGDVRRPLAHVRELPPEIRKLGEKGMAVTRFKGLGEMEPNELWDTTLNPAVRILIKVKLEDALKAEEMFRTLMGEKVEPRREFIQKHALEVTDLDYHGA